MATRWWCSERPRPLAATGDRSVTGAGSSRAIVSFGGGPPRACRRGAATGLAPNRRATTERATAALAAGALALVAACVRTTTVTYLPSPDQPRLTLAEGEATLARFVGVECERLRGAGRAAAETRVLVRHDGAGQATSSELAASTGDSRVDGLVGAVAAQLRLEPGRSPVELRVGYRCADDGGVAVTLERQAAR